MELKERIEELEGAVRETVNIVQLLRDAVERTEESVYIARGLATIEKMLKSICDNEIAVLKNNV